ncbi:MAG TPA: fluoride efflux transporter CrcB [Verrucomicrobiales bacterium]|nr:fluoride efflux transporter CrcB [Verrucomicrobiales bacterium]
MWKALLPLVVGGSLGAVSRWGLHQWIDTRAGANSPFPWGILIVNVGGCFLFGWLFAYCEGKAWSTEAVRLALFTGFLGSFTTFSTFGWNTLELLRTGAIGLAIANVGASVLLGLLAVWAGFLLGR